MSGPPSRDLYYPLTSVALVQQSIEWTVEDPEVNWNHR